MTEEGLSSNSERQLSYQARCGRIELKKPSRTVLVKYYVCCSNILCIRVLGYTQQGSTASASGGQELVDELHLPADLKRSAEPHKEVIRRCIMTYPTACFSIDSPVVQFLTVRKTWPTETLLDDHLQILISCAVCRENEAAIFQTDGDYIIVLIAGRK